MDQEEVVLVVEDDGVNRKLLAGMLEKLGYSVQAVENGVEAWDQLQKLEESSQEKLVAVFSDVVMPEMVGGNLLEKVRASEAFRELPFFMVSAHDDEFFKHDAKRFGASGYIVKPFTFEDIQKALEGLDSEKASESA